MEGSTLAYSQLLHTNTNILKQYCKKYKIKRYSKLSRDDIINILKYYCKCYDCCANSLYTQFLGNYCQKCYPIPILSSNFNNMLLSTIGYTIYYINIFILGKINSQIIYNNDNNINRVLIDESFFNKLVEFTENNDIIVSNTNDHTLKKSNGELISLRLFSKINKLYCYKVDFNLDNIVPIEIFKNVYNKFFNNTHTLFIKDFNLYMLNNIEYNDNLVNKELFYLKFNNSTIIIFYNDIILIEINKQINSVYMYYNNFLKLFYDIE